MQQRSRVAIQGVPGHGVVGLQKSLLLLLLVGIIQLLLASVCWPVEVGSPPPDFQLTTLEGKSFRLSEHKGELIILKLATTWCPSCRQQGVELDEAAPLLKARNIRLVEVFLQDTEAMVRDYLAETSFESPFDAMLDDGQVLKAYSIYLIPRVILIDSEFKVLRDGANLTAGQIEEAFRGK